MMDRSERLASAFVQLADTLVADYDVAELTRPLIDDAIIRRATAIPKNIWSLSPPMAGFRVGRRLARCTPRSRARSPA
jgi:hypothetical protein